MDAQPTGLSLEGNTLTIQWSDGHMREYEVSDLRRNCPCAKCQTERTQMGGQDVPLPADPQVGLRGMEPVGNYAYKIAFTDGHDTGIYALDLLRELGRPT